MGSISAIAFPYCQSYQTEVILNRFILTDASDKSRYVFQMDNVKGKQECISIDKIMTDSGERYHEPFNYISNTLPDSSTPLLMKCGWQLYKMKLSLSIKCTLDDQNKSLYIVKTKDTNCNMEQIKHSLKANGDRGSDVEVSQIRFDQLPLDPKVDTLQKIIINDSYNNSVFNDCVINLYLFRSDGTSFDHVLDFKFWADKDGSPNGLSLKETELIKQEEHSLQFSEYRSAFSFILDDGPEFRKVLNKHEQAIPSIQKNAVLLIEEVKNMEVTMKRLLNSKTKIYEIIRNFSTMNPILSKVRFKEDFKKQLNELFEKFSIELNFFLTQVCEKKTLERIRSISSFDEEKNELNTLKKTFEHDSKDFYNWLKKYLSNEKDRPELKLLMKRKKFELSKFDYLNYLSNFTNNQYINEFIENLFKFTDIDLSKQIPSDLKKIGLADYQNIYVSMFLKYQSEKLKLRQMIELCKSNDELTNLIRFNNLTIDEASNNDTIVTKDNMHQIFTPTTPKGSLPNSMEKMSLEASASSTEELGEKSGILYALGGKGKQGWHKEWVVIKAGELNQYSDWRKGSDAISAPIQIALSNVKPTTYDKRQHCIEIFTSQGNKYVFQAMDAQERDSWLKALENARQLINTDKLQESLTTGGSTNNTNSSHTQKIGKKLLLKLEKPKVTQSADSIFSPISVKSSSIITKDYYKTVRSIVDSNNHICADCGSTESVEWISLNFLVVLCIKCSSFHRNMGSHISKVKSLKLDNFDHEVEVLLGYMNNKSHNGILEKKVTFDKSTITEYDSRLQFIKDKYIERKYTEKLENVNELLLKSIQTINIENTIKYVLLKGNLDSAVQLRDKTSQVTLFEYSLRKYLVVENNEGSERLFVISEFLALNGCKINKIHKELDLSLEAYTFWEKRYLKTV